VSSAKDVAKIVLEDAREVLREHEPSFLINLMVCSLVRDLNAARNILGRGLERALAETGPLLVPVVRTSKFRRGGEKPTSIRSA
jgi:hypothetical protein